MKKKTHTYTTWLVQNFVFLFFFTSHIQPLSPCEKFISWNQLITVPHQFQCLPFVVVGFQILVVDSLNEFYCFCMWLHLFFLCVCQLIYVIFFFFLCAHSESNSLSPPFFTGTNGTAQKGRPRKRKLMINHHQNDPLNLGTAMQMGTYTFYQFLISKLCFCFLANFSHRFFVVVIFSIDFQRWIFFLQRKQ